MPFENTDTLNAMLMADSTAAGSHSVEHLTFDAVPDSVLGAYFAGHQHVGQKIHLYRLVAIASALLAAATLDIE